MPFDKLIYVAGPYRGDVKNNIKRAEEAAIELWRKGWAVICPHLNTANFEKYENNGISAETWIQGDLSIIEGCHAIFMLDNWDRSEGAIQERLHAEKHGLEIYYQKDGYPEPGELPADEKIWQMFSNRSRSLSLNKRRDYASEADPLKNLRICGQFGIVTRISDKVMRLINLCWPGKKPSNESVEDTIIDLFNYAYLLHYLRREENDERRHLQS